MATSDTAPAPLVRPKVTKEVFNWARETKSFWKSLPVLPDGARVAVVLRRDSANEPYRWVPVRAQRLVAPYWPGPLFSYRAGKLVFIVDGLTGIHVWFDVTVPACRAGFEQRYAGMGGRERREWREALDKLCYFFAPGPRPQPVLRDAT